jgi:hypothetical protein
MSKGMKDSEWFLKRIPTSYLTVSHSGARSRRTPDIDPSSHGSTNFKVLVFLSTLKTI